MPLFFYALKGHGRRFAPEAPQRSEDSKSVTALAVNSQPLPGLFFFSRIFQLCVRQMVEDERSFSYDNFSFLHFC